jgi:hypothetical protein
VLRDHTSGALSGQSIAVLDPQQKLVLDVFPCEDGHAQELSLFPEILQTVNPEEVWIADRNFCTRSFLLGIAQRQAYFVIRAYQNLPWQALTLLVEIGETETGKIFEQKIQITDDLGVTLEGRRVVIQLHQPTRHGDREVSRWAELNVRPEWLKAPSILAPCAK